MALTAAAGLVEAECHVTTACHRRVAGTRRGADTFPVPIVGGVSLVVREIAQRAPAPRWVTATSGARKDEQSGGSENPFDITEV